MELSTKSEDRGVLVKTNAPSEWLGKRIAHQGVESGLAACVNLGGPTLTMYMWKATLESAQEVPITFKTTGARALALMEHIKSIHPYEVPEILVLPVIAGLDDYIEWIKDCTRER